MRTDLDDLKWILSLASSIEQLAKWKFCLSEFDSEVLRRAAIESKPADALPRLETDVTNKTLNEDDIRNLVVF